MRSGNCIRKRDRAGASLIREGLAAGRNRKTFLFVNNRLKGNALELSWRCYKRRKAGKETRTLIGPKEFYDFLKELPNGSVSPYP